MTNPAKLNEYNHAEKPARVLLGRLGWTYVPRETLAAERGGEREVLLKGRMKAALLRLNEWMTEEQVYRAIFDLEHIDATGMARSEAIHEYLNYGMPMTVDGLRGRDSRIVRFFDFDHPEGGLNEFVVTTSYRVRRGNERGGTEDDERMVILDLVLFVNGIPLVVMEAKSPSLLEVWKSQAVRQLRRTRRRDRNGRAEAHRSCSTITCCAWSIAGLPRPTLALALRRTLTLSGSRCCLTRRMRCACASASSRRGRPSSLSACCLPQPCWTFFATMWSTSRSGDVWSRSFHATSSTARFALPWSDCSPAVSRRNGAEWYGTPRGRANR